MKTLEEMRWERATIDAYKPVENEAKWLACPKCKVKPRAWEFDNGRYAKCHCSDKYGAPQAEAMAIHEHYRKRKTLGGYERSRLRRNWNHHVHVMMKQGAKE